MSKQKYVGNVITLLLLGTFIFLMLPSVSAEVELIFPYNTDISINRACFNNGTFCSTTAICNMTAFYPNGEVLINNQLMTNQVSHYSISVEKTQLRRFGWYSSIMTCKDGSVNGGDTFDFEVTANGRPRSPFPIQFAIILLGIVMGCTGIFSSRLRLLKYLSGILLMVMGVATIFPGYSYLNYSNIEGYAVGLVSLGLGFYFMLEDSLSFDRQVDHMKQFDSGRDDGRIHD